MEHGEIILYQPDDSLRLEVRLDGDNVWLNRSQLAELAEGTQEWKLLRLDADYLFNRDYTGPDIWDETLNYISVGLEDWRK